VTIETLAAGGDGIGRDASGRVVFAPYTAPGDRVRARVSEEHRRFVRALPVELIEAGPGRAEPPCPLFRDRSCGGCQWQHLSSEVQAEAKRSLVASALRHRVAEGMELSPLRSSVPPYGWRRRARLHWFRPRGSDRAVVGFFAPRSRHVTLVEACPQIEPALEAALAPIHRLLAPGLHKRGEIEIVAGAGGEVHAAISGPHNASAAAALAGAAPIIGVRAGKRSWGADKLELEPGLGGRADWFAQASRAGNQDLLAAVAEAAGPREGLSVVEFYAGTGNLTRVLAEGARKLTAVDTHPGKRSEQGPVRWRRGEAGIIAAEMVRAGERFDLAVLDPPRTGARALMAPLAELAPARVVYVSCDPATLSRDAADLIAAGYRAERAIPLDLMPQTAHVEVVLILTLSP
jgi:23S rRNA (uracil1939-C5)-methyltransferase